MSARRRRTERDRRRRSFGQNFLVDRETIDRFIAGLELEEDELVVDIGAGRGALTFPLVRAGARVVAVEVDQEWSTRLAGDLRRAGLEDRVHVVRTDLRSYRLPKVPYRVAASPPYGLTTALLEHLLDDPTKGPERADLIVQRQVAAKHASTPPIALRTAAWVPWWTFELADRIDRSCFRPRPSVDSAVLRIARRDPALLPHRLAGEFRELLRPAWD